MQPRIPQQSADSGGAVRPESDDRLRAEVISVVAGARRRAMRDGDRQIDTAHLLHSLLESDPAVRTAFGEGPQTVRVLGYLVQRSIGYGLQWQSSVEDSGAVPVVGAATAVRDTSRDIRWSPSAAAALERAVARARRRGEHRARGLDLFVALLADRECRAVEVLLHSGVEPAEVGARAAAGLADAGREEWGSGDGAAWPTP
ncbi:Clp protease N-terminal domain-containing protein [Streptomyces uncialis]|uniref:Clp protease N-terminal domain-containing protein n=1 Tax=Streptomyces uncialis TaxID=1048205 RepID=UPI0037ADA4FE